MDDNKLRFGVGVLVISAIGIGIILVFLFGAFPSVLRRDYTLLVRFPSAEGIAVNSAVMRDGVRVGRVADIQLHQEGGVLITLSMDSSKDLTHEYIPRIRPGNFVTGDSKLEFVKETRQRLNDIHANNLQIIPTPYTPGELVNYGDKASSLFDMQRDLQETLDAIQTAAIGVNDAAESLQGQGDEIDRKVGQAVVQAGTALQEFSVTMERIQSIVPGGDFKTNLEQSVAKLNTLLDKADGTVDDANQTLDQLQKVGSTFQAAGSSAQDAFDNLEQITRPFAEQSGALQTQVLRTLASIETNLGEFGALSRSINNSDGTFRRLLEDDEIYWRLRRTIENIETATAKVEPIMSDIRVFSDKIARDPRQLGVRGAISRRPSGAGLK